MHRPVRVVGGPAVRAACGGNLSLSWLPPAVVRPDPTLLELGRVQGFAVHIPPIKGAGMKYRRLGTTGLRVSVIGVGTWQLGGEWGRRFTQGEVDELLGRARTLGVNLVDTAECYGDHLAEAFIGGRDPPAARRLGGRHQVRPPVPLRGRAAGWRVARPAAHPIIGRRPRWSPSWRRRCGRLPPTTWT